MPWYWSSYRIFEDEVCRGSKCYHKYIMMQANLFSRSVTITVIVYWVRKFEPSVQFEVVATFNPHLFLFGSLRIWNFGQLKKPIRVVFFMYVYRYIARLFYDLLSHLLLLFFMQKRQCCGDCRHCSKHKICGKSYRTCRWIKQSWHACRLHNRQIIHKRKG